MQKKTWCFLDENLQLVGYEGGIYLQSFYFNFNMKFNFDNEFQ